MNRAASRTTGARAGSLALLALAACSQPTVQTPTRAMDRPSDVALVCAYPDDARGFVMGPVATCGEARSDKDSRPKGHLFTFVTNTARGELALAAATQPGNTKTAGGQIILSSPLPGGGSGVEETFCIDHSEILDLDPATPGYGFLPVGNMPEHVRASGDGCRVVTANTNSCDLSVVEVPGLLRTLRHQCQDQETGLVHPAAPPALDAQPSDFVRRLVVRARGGAPILSRPTWIDFSVDTTATGGSQCLATAKYRAYVAFPGCGLIADVNLDTGEIRQALKVTRTGAYAVDPATVRCPAECAAAPLDGGVGADPLDGAASEGGAPEDAATPDDGATPDDAAPTDASAPVDAAASDGGVKDGGLPPIFPGTQALPRTIAVDYDIGRLYIGDAASDRVTVVDLEKTAAFGAVRAIKLENPGGVEVLRLSPRFRDPKLMGDPGIRYLYAIARDRTVRVVDADSEVECETNPDGRILAQQLPMVDAAGKMLLPPQEVIRALRCLPVGSPSTPRRSPLASNPGITLPGGALPRDVSFISYDKHPVATNTNSTTRANPALMVGDFAWIVDSAGRAIAVNIADRCPAPNNPATINDLESCKPEAYEPSLPEALLFAGSPRPEPIDIMPNRLRSGNARFLPPSSVAGTSTGSPRLSDLPFVADVQAVYGPYDDSLNLCLVPAAGDIPNTGADGGVADGGTTSGTPSLCSRTASVVSYFQRIVRFRDPSVVRNETWRIDWEGEIPGTTRSGGSVNGATVVDPTASYCARAVLPDDKVTIAGCGSDGDCGPAQMCWLDPGRPTGATGLCVGREIVDGVAQPRADAQARCTDWTRAVRRYRVTESLPTRLVFDEIAEPEALIDTRACASDAECADVNVPAVVGGVAVLLPTVCGVDRPSGARHCVRACQYGGTREAAACGEGFVCARSKYDPNGRCIRAPLPPDSTSDLHGLCFGQLQFYSVSAGDSFIVRGESSGLFENGYTDPATGRCAVPQPGDPSRASYRARIPVRPDAPYCPTDVAATPARWLDPLPASAPAACRLDDKRLDPTRYYVRYGNPVIDLVLVVPQLSTGVIGGGGDGGVSDGGAGGARAYTRAPLAGAAMSMDVIGGYFALNYILGSEITAQLPRAIVSGPDQRSTYIVDEGRQTAASGLRGQVIRFFTDTQSSDREFIVR